MVTRNTAEPAPTLRWRLSIAASRHNGVCVLTLSGRLSRLTVPTFRQAVERFLGPGAAGVVLDLGAVDYVSSAGLKAIRALSDRVRAAGGGLAVCNAAGPVRLGLELGGVLDEVPCATTVDDAVRAATRR